MFMKNALLAVLLITPIFGILGTMIINNKMAFFSDALGHSALTGIAIGVILGVKDPLWAMILFSVLLGLTILTVKNANTASMDTIIGVFSATAVSLGVVILSHSGGFTKYSAYLIGDLLSITPENIYILALVLLVVFILWFFIFNKLLLFSINKALAKSRRVNVRLIEYLFTFIIAVIVTISIQWVGLLIINSLLILPAAAARNVAKNIRQYHILSIFFAVVSGILGLILSYFWGTATGATIVLVCATFFILTFILKPKFV
ncbi:MAG: metal ABC transporter permease [Candidatus Gastranaerophilaceae bacterium]|jgi:zinc transport system permease protein